MKKHNTVKVVLIVILLFLLLSWILPAAYYSSSYVEQGRVQMGLFDLVNYPFTSLSYFGYIALFIILVGGFYGVLNKIPAYHDFVEKLAAKLKGKEIFALSIISIILAFGVSICGLQIAFAIFIPLLVSLIFLMGYDKIVAALVIVGSMTVGLAGSTYATTNLSVLTQTLSLKTDYQIGVRFVILLVGIALVIFNTIMYIKKNKKAVAAEDAKSIAVKVTDEVMAEEIAKEEAKKEEKEEVEEKKTSSKKTSTKKSSTKKSTKKTTSKNANKAALVDEDVIVANNGKHYKTATFYILFGLLFILMVLAFIPWESAFGIKAMSTATDAVSKFELFGFNIFGKILGTMNAFGSWTLVDLLLPLLLVTIIFVIIYKVKLDDALDGFAEGAKKALLPACIVILLYTVLVLVTYHPFQLVIYKAILGSKFNIVTTTITAILSSFFNFEASYVFQSVLPYYASVVTNSANYPLVGVIFQSMYGLTMLVAPTSLILMSVLSYLDVSYGEWLKNIWKLLLELFIILLIIFIILALI